MFTPTKPFNTLPLLPTKFNNDQVEIHKATNKANIALAKLNVKAEKIPNSLLLVSPLLVRESVLLRTSTTKSSKNSKLGKLKSTLKSKTTVMPTSTSG